MKPRISSQAPGSPAHRLPTPWLRKGTSLEGRRGFRRGQNNIVTAQKVIYIALEVTRLTFPASPKPVRQCSSSPFVWRGRLAISNAGPGMFSPCLAEVAGPGAGVCRVVHLAKGPSDLFCGCVGGIVRAHPLTEPGRPVPGPPGREHVSRKRNTEGTGTHARVAARETSRKVHVEGAGPHALCAQRRVLRTNVI